MMRQIALGIMCEAAQLPLILSIVLVIIRAVHPARQMRCGGEFWPNNKWYYCPKLQKLQLNANWLDSELYHCPKLSKQSSYYLLVIRAAPSREGFICSKAVPQSPRVSWVGEM